MLDLLSAALETVLYFTSDVVLWGVIYTIELALETLVSLGSFLFTVGAVLTPATFSLLQQLFYFSLYTVEVIYVVS